MVSEPEEGRRLGKAGEKKKERETTGSVSEQRIFTGKAQGKEEWGDT